MTDKVAELDEAELDEAGLDEAEIDLREELERQERLEALGVGGDRKTLERVRAALAAIGPRREALQQAAAARQTARVAALQREAGELAGAADRAANEALVHIRKFALAGVTAQRAVDVLAELNGKLAALGAEDVALEAPLLLEWSGPFNLLLTQARCGGLLGDAS